jgi:hypothetical protein
MVSNLKSETARINGAKSRGPTTEEGKQKSSRNALKHGLTASSGNILLDSEDRGEFDKTLNKLLGIHEPATPAETDIVDEMVAARWRIRRMWTIETGLLNAEILTQQSNPSVSEGDPDIHLSMAFRALADDSRSLALANRYEARLQRTYDRAYKTLRELQQARKSEPPEQPQNFQIKWVDSQEGMDMRAAASATAQEPEPPTEPTDPASPTAPSVSEGEREDSPTEPRASVSAASPTEPRASASAANPTEPRASASGPSPKIPNEPTAAANPVAQAFVPVFRNPQPPTFDSTFSPGTPEPVEKM